MALSTAEQAEMAQLEKEVGSGAQKPSSGLTPAEQSEMQSLQKEVGHLDQNPGVAQTALEHGANAAALGYLPQMQAYAQPAIYAGLNAITGQNVPNDKYVDARDENIKRLQSEEAANPKTAMASQIGGGLVGAMATPIPGGAAKSVVGGLLKGAGYGAAYGGLSNPGDTEGEINALQLADRAKNAVKGAVIGGAVGGATKGASKLLSGAADGLTDMAENQAVRAGGADLRTMRALEGRDQTNKLGRYLLDNNMVGAGSTVDSTAEKSLARNNAASEELNKIYSIADDAAKNNPEVGGFNPSADKDEILAAANKSLGSAEGKAAAVNRLGSYLDQVKGDMGERTLLPSEANNIKTSLDKTINYERNPLKGSPVAEQAFGSGRGLVANKIANQVGELGELSGNNDLGQRLKDTNLDYGMSKRATDMSADRVAREKANRMFGLTDTIAGGAGVGAGALANLAMGGHDLKSQAEFGVGGLLAGALLNKVGRTYGPGLMAAGLNRGGQAAGLIDPALQPMSAGIGSQAMTRALIEKQLLENKLKSAAPKAASPEIRMAQ